MTRRNLYVALGALVVATIVIGYLLYQERQTAATIDIDVGNGSISIEAR